MTNYIIRFKKKNSMECIFVFICLFEKELFEDFFLLLQSFLSCFIFAQKNIYFRLFFCQNGWNISPKIIEKIK